MTNAEKQMCRRITRQGGGTIDGIKTSCGDRFQRTGCVKPSVGADGVVNLGSNRKKVCGCVKEFVNACEGKGLFCLLRKVGKCPKVCGGVKDRVNDALAASLLDAKGAEAVEDGTGVLVDPKGTSSSMIAQGQSHNISMAQRRDQVGVAGNLDHGMTGKCSE